LTYTSSLNINNELTKTVFSKVTADGDNLYGVPMEIVDVKTGKPVHTWITDDSSLEIDGLPTGDYIWREVNAPEGYVLAKPIEFTVKDGDIQDIEMKNFSVEFAKNGNDGNKLLKGGEFQVTSTKTKQITDKWTSGEHIFDITEDMKTKLTSGEVVSDMFINIEDDSSTYYRISKNADRDDYRLLMQANGETKYYNIDINGDETTHMIRGTVEDQEYVITELKSPDGYATAEPVSFKTNKEQNLTVDMTDEITQFEFYKKDITSQEELEGATLQIKDKNGNIVDEWVSGKTPHKITGLTVGQTYTMIEVIAPVNYKIAQNKEFTVSDTGEVQKITMYDELMPVAKKVKT
ncbi:MULTISPECIES: SpaA isopeptide-forming pilin-related protein, partial [Thomasclavelia]